jgi:hypothetical protein
MRRVRKLSAHPNRQCDALDRAYDALVVLGVFDVIEEGCEIFAAAGAAQLGA